MNQQNIITDISALTGIQPKVFESLTDKINLCIGSIIYEAKQAKEESVLINIGIGTLSVDLINMQCKFLPGKDLKVAIKQYSEKGVDPLELKLDKMLSDKLIALCEEEF